jgi:hypothetical protein
VEIEEEREVEEVLVCKEESAVLLLLLLLLLERLPRSFELEERRKCNKSEDAC